MKALILAGGSGTRLWPLSRRHYPKQFLKLNGDKSLLQQTVERLYGIVSPCDMVVMTNNDYKFHVKADLIPLFSSSAGNVNRPKAGASSLSDPMPYHMILEPASRNTGPAIALGARYCIDKLGCGKKEVVFVSPSDHVIRPVERFREYLVRAEELAGDGHIVTFGIKPSRPETGYGYIKAAPEALRSRHCSGLGCYKVEAFTEKPDLATAERYLEEGRYYWNSGMFIFSIGTIMNEFRKHEPRIGRMLDRGFDEMARGFSEMPDISIDYSIMEKSDRVVTLPVELYWNDIGSWDSLFDALDRDENSNAKSGDVITIDTKNTMVIAGKRLISTIGLEDCLIVETGDAVLVAKRGEAQKVREIVGRLRKDGRREVSEHLTTYRPWGSYTILEEGPRFKIKRIVVNPCEKLSFQIHYHRSEHWVVVQGTARVTLGEKEILLHENESAYVPKSTPHRLENPGKIPLEIIEVQNGEYVGEDDIVRMDDVYGRHDADTEKVRKVKKARKAKGKKIDKGKIGDKVSMAKRRTV